MWQGWHLVVVLLSPSMASPVDVLLGPGQSEAPTSNPSMVCMSGSYSGGDIHRVNLTATAAIAWCMNATKCAGFTAKAVYSGPASCARNDVELDVHFKDR